MTRYPSPSAYQEALQFPDTALLDPTLRAATVEVNALGLPAVVTGAFSAVFSLYTPTERWALKCFLTDVEGQAARYQALARYQARAALPYLLPFRYHEAGIRVEGGVWPVLQMAWAEGLPLNRYVARHHADPARMAALAEAWAAMLARLEAAGFAHGDLQHGNVLVDPEGHLTLVDYDTAYVPALRGARSPERGHRNYQHPDRTERDASPRLDRFAGLVVFTALEALRHAPPLWARYDTGENLLFRAADFYDPDASPLLAELAGMAPLQALVAAVRAACLGEPGDVPSLEAVRQGRAGAPVGRQAPRRAARRLPTARPPREGVARWGLPLFLAALSAAAGLGAVHPALGAGAAVLVALGAAAVVMGVHRRLPLVRRRRRLVQEVGYLRSVLRSLADQAEAVRARRRSLREGLAARQAERLRRLQAEALQARLNHHFVDEARQVEGISHKVVVRLKRAGVRNAYHASPERLATVPGLSDESRARLAQWRAALVRQYQADVPQALSPAEAQRLERHLHHQTAAFDADLARLEEKRRFQEAELRQVEARLAELPRVGWGRVLRYLLYLGTLPAAPTAPVPRHTPPPGTSPPQAAPPAGEAAPPAGEAAPPAGEAAPWWVERGGD